MAQDGATFASVSGIVEIVENTLGLFISFLTAGFFHTLGFHPEVLTPRRRSRNAHSFVWAPPKNNSIQKMNRDVTQFLYMNIDLGGEKME